LGAGFRDQSDGRRVLKKKIGLELGSHYGTGLENKKKTTGTKWVPPKNGSPFPSQKIDSVCSEKLK